MLNFILMFMNKKTKIKPNLIENLSTSHAILGEDFINNLVGMYVADIANKRNAIIKEGLKRIGLDFENIIEQVKTRRFKPVMCVTKNDVEYWYYDNGTTDGRLFLTFDNNPVITQTPEGYKIESQFTYQFK